MPGLSDATSGTFSASLLRKAVLMPSLYQALRERTARRYMYLHATTASLALFKPDAIVPWVSYLFPTELLASYGITPLIPELGSAALTGTPSREFLESAAARMPLARDVCSYHRTALAAVENGLMPAPSMCIDTSPLCLGKGCLLEMLAIRHGVPFREVTVPMRPMKVRLHPTWWPTWPTSSACCTRTSVVGPGGSHTYTEPLSYPTGLR
jgi:hypothetical protein